MRSSIFQLFSTVALAACGSAALTNNVLAGEAEAQPAANAQDKQGSGMPDFSYVEGGGMPGCFDPGLSGRERAVAERLGGTPCEPSKANASSGPVAGDFAGYWTGQMDGAGGSATIAASGRGRYGVRVEMADASGCTGELQGQAQMLAGRLVLTARNQYVEGQCRLTFSRQGRSLVVEEDNCGEHHAAACAFSGRLDTWQSNDNLEPESHSE
ncbi:MAG TPA: hypothetical protein VEX16_03720 [Methyloceanibacter sp.]|nr:hypothetical protein [Methyloceanibacter sp.]